MRNMVLCLLIILFAVPAFAEESEKEGMAYCTLYFNTITVGNCSIEAAKRNGEIELTEKVRIESKEVLGLFTEYRVIVTGS